MENNAERTITISQNSWLHWTLANFAALFVAILAVLPVAVNLAYADHPPWLRGAVRGAALGLALGAAQWWLLRPQVTGAAWWIVANAIR